MKRLLVAASLGGATAALTIGTATPASAAPAGVGSAEDTVEAFESAGYRVVVDRIGRLPLGRCSVDSVRAGEGVMRPMGGGERSARPTVYLTARC